MKNLPANEKYTLGITTEFDPIWNQFKESIDDMDKADLIRKLIFQHLASKTLSDDNWNRIKNALKTYKKFNDDKLELDEIYKGFYVINYNDYYRTADDESIKEYLGEYEFFNGRSFPAYDYYLVLKKKSSADINHISRRLCFYKKRPGIKLVIEKKKRDGYQILEGYYSSLKNKENSVVDLLRFNQWILGSYGEEQLFNQVNIDVKLEDENYSLMDVNMDLLEKHTDYGKIPLNDTPKEIDEQLIIKSYHLKNKKNFKELKKDQKIQFTHSVFLEFDSKDKNRMIDFPSAEGGWDKITDGKINENQIIEVED